MELVQSMKDSTLLVARRHGGDGDTPEGWPHHWYIFAFDTRAIGIGNRVEQIDTIRLPNSMSIDWSSYSGLCRLQDRNVCNWRAGFLALRRVGIGLLLFDMQNDRRPLRQGTLCVVFVRESTSHCDTCEPVCRRSASRAV